MSFTMNGKLLKIVGVIFIVLGVFAGLYYSRIINYVISHIEYAMASPESKHTWAAIEPITLTPLLFWVLSGCSIGLVLMGFGKFLEKQDK